MATSAELNTLTAKELGSLAKNLAIAGWHEMRKDELVHALVLKSRTKNGRELIHKRLAQPSAPVKKKSEPQKSSAPTSKPVEKPASSSKKSPSSVVPEAVKDAQKKREVVIVAEPPKNAPFSDAQSRRKLRRDISTQAGEERKDQLVLLVRDPYWIHAFWELTPKAVERAKVALGQFWHTAVPIIRLFRLDSDGVTQPRRVFIRDVLIHGGVNNWYLDVLEPPAAFQIEIGYISREKKFYPLLSSNTVTTPQQKLIDQLDQLDGNWRGVADDLNRVYKMSSGGSNNQELKKVFEEQLRRPMSIPLISRYRAQGEKTRRHFLFNLDADLIVHGKTDPSVQVTIRNEPIKINPDGTFTVRFAFPEKRHVFPIEAEGSDGIETQRVILTVERNTRFLETLFQEPANED